MENAEEIYLCLEDFTKRRPKSIPRELEEYLHFVARTGDPVYQWSIVKSLFKEKLLTVITEFFETSPGLDIPQCPNVDIFNYETMKNSLLEKIDAFTSAPFTVQRICELLTSPRKQYNRIDKFMRAVEKNILVVSTRDPGTLRHSESENGEGPDTMVNGSDSNSEYNVDVEMEDMSTWKVTPDPLETFSAQASSSDSNRTVDSSSAPFVSQNGPAEEERTSPEVELMTIEPDTHLTAIEDDAPEPSINESDLSPSEEEPKNNNDPLPESSESTPVSSVSESEESIATSSEVQESSEQVIESTQDNEAVVSTSKECDAKLENPKVSNSSDSSNSIENESPKENITADLPMSDSTEEKVEVTSNVVDDSTNTSSDIVDEDNKEAAEVVEKESVPSPDTSSEDKLLEPESMDTVAEASTTDVDVDKPEMEAEAPQVDSATSNSSEATPEEATQEISASVEMEDTDSKDDHSIDNSSSSPVSQGIPESPKDETSSSDDITIAEETKGVEDTSPIVSSSEPENSGDKADTRDSAAIEITGVTIEKALPESPVSVESEITSSKDCELSAENQMEPDENPKDVEHVESVVEAKPSSPLQEVSAADSVAREDS